MATIKNLIFDLGGVIVTISQEQAVRRFTELGLADAARQLNPYTQGGIFGDLESGKINAEDFRRELSILTGRQLTHDECLYGWLGYRYDLPERNLDFLRTMRKEGFRLFLLSNTNPYMMEWAESPDFDGRGNTLSSYFDATYKSYEVKLMKPDLRFFQHVLSSEHIQAGESLFVDDGPRNVTAAQQLGLHTFCPVNGEDWTSALYDYIHQL